MAIHWAREFTGLIRLLIYDDAMMRPRLVLLGLLLPCSFPFLVACEDAVGTMTTASSSSGSAGGAGGAPGTGGAKDTAPDDLSVLEQGHPDS